MKPKNDVLVGGCMVIITIKCPYCQSEAIVRNGHAPNGKQKYLCKNCKRQTRENPTDHGYSEKEKERILKAYQEHSSLRGLKRTFGVERNTVTRWIKKAAELPPLSETLVKHDAKDPEATIMELDELWSFVLKKTNQSWIWIALCRKTRQIVAHAVGDRSNKMCKELWNSIPEEYRKGHCYSDFWSAYQAIIPEEQHTAVGKETGETAHVERWNNTLRQRLGRFVRKTLSFSKSIEMHISCLELFLHRYNRERAIILM